MPEITNRLKSKFIEHGLEFVYKNEHKLSNLLCANKTKKPPLSKSGIYVYECDVCHKKYYGQTKRSIECRFGEHLSYIRLNHPYKSAIADHAINDGHNNVHIERLNLHRQVRDEKSLDVYEAFYIQKDENTFNKDRGNIESSLFALL